MARSPEQLRQDLLVIRSQNGDRKALEKLVRQWQRRLWRIALEKLDDQDTAWDVIQETWLAIIQGLHRLREPEAFDRWVTQIISNIAANSIRRTKRRTHIDRMMPRRKQNQDPLIEVLLERHFLTALSLSQRVVITLYYLDRKSISEIAKTLNVPCGTVKSRLYYARKKLKYFLEVNHVQYKR
jgi:RNA polymerase sigma-70 factor (ECF subfamily)